MTGVAELREQIAIKHANSSRGFDPESEITITLGATEAIFSAIIALVHPGDEVILLDPAYDSYAPAVVLAGGRPVHVPLQPPHFAVDWERVQASISSRTRMVMINSPHNPTGSVIPASDLDVLAEILRPTGVLVLADEVYEHMIFDGARHASILAHAELYERGLGVYSFGKTMHATGWRVGYAIAPPPITQELRRVHQFNTFSIAAPLQYAIADFLKLQPQHNEGLSAFYERKRDLFLDSLKTSRFSWTPAPGTYFQLLDYSAISDQSDMTFADTLLRDAGVATIPVSPFYASPPQLAVVRLCFAKEDSTLRDAAARLCRI
jgi:methionine aminotransferase